MPTSNRSVSDAISLCAVSPAPQLRERLKAAARDAREAVGLPVAAQGSLLREPQRLGFNDGVIKPPSEFAPGVTARTVRSAAMERAPLRGQVRVLVVLIDFEDKHFGQPASRFSDLFFSAGEIPTGSVKEYYSEVTSGLVDIVGEVVGPYTMPHPLAWYANGNYGIGNPSGEARANIMALDAIKAANPNVDLAPYDNDRNGYVDAFVVVHAGRGGEETGDPGDIWSHKWVLPKELNADGTKVYAYLTIPEDAKLGVSAHELGHLLFGFPDLYDTDYTSEGIGNWCLMAGGSWNGGGDRPAHPSAWCKAQQGWVSVENVTTPGVKALPDVKTAGTVTRLWTGGQSGREYFLLENRQRAGYDADLPGAGLLIWHVDESQDSNTDENHYLVALVQADGMRQLEHDANRGDDGDPFPGSSQNSSFSPDSSPSSQSYGGQDTGIVVAEITGSADPMAAKLSVSGDVTPPDGGDEPDKLASTIADLKARLAVLEVAANSAGTALSTVSPQGA